MGKIKNDEEIDAEDGYERGRLCRKTETSRHPETLGRVLTDQLILAAVTLYIFGFLLWLLVLSSLELSFVYPLLVLAYLVNLLLAHLVLATSIPWEQWWGIRSFALGLRL